MRESDLENTVLLLKALLEAKPERKKISKQAVDLQRFKHEAAKEAFLRIADYCLALARGIDAQIDVVKMLGDIDDEQK